MPLLSGELFHQGVRLILMRCAGYNNVDLARQPENVDMKVLQGSWDILLKQWLNMPWHWFLTANRHTHKAYIKCRENNFSLNGLMGVNLYGKTAGIVGTGKIGLAMARICRGFGMNIFGL